jgi:phenylpyruvate tautomerase
MPLIRLELSEVLTEDKKAHLLKAASKAVAETMGKPESYVMAVLAAPAAILMAGKHTKAAWVEVRGIGGFGTSVNRTLSEVLCTLLSHELKIHPEAVYLNFVDVSAENWGWKGTTFG